MLMFVLLLLLPPPPPPPPMLLLLLCYAIAWDHLAPKLLAYQLFDEGPERTAWFPMVIILDVLEEGTGDDGEDVTSQYEVCKRDISLFLAPALPAVRSA